MQEGGYTTANYIWDLLETRKIVPFLPAVEAYYKGLKVFIAIESAETLSLKLLNKLSLSI